MRDYNYLDKILHNLVFKYKLINLSLFEIEKLFFNKNLDIENNMHVFIFRFFNKVNRFRLFTK